MDRTLQAAQEGEALRQQQAMLLAAVQAERQEQLERTEAEAAAARKAHQQVCSGALCRAISLVAVCCHYKATCIRARLAYG